MPGALTISAKYPGKEIAEPPAGGMTTVQAAQGRQQRRTLPCGLGFLGQGGVFAEQNQSSMGQQ